MKKFLFILLISKFAFAEVVNGGAGSGLANAYAGTPVYGDIRDWGYMLQAQGAYILEISLARVYSTEAALKEARTLHLETQVAMLQEYLGRLRLELRTLNMRQRTITRRQAIIERSATQINALKLGRTSKSALNALRSLYLYDAI